MRPPYIRWEFFSAVVVSSLGSGLELANATGLGSRTIS